MTTCGRPQASTATTPWQVTQNPGNLQTQDPWRTQRASNEWSSHSWQPQVVSEVQLFRSQRVKKKYALVIFTPRLPGLCLSLDLCWCQSGRAQKTPDSRYHQALAASLMHGATCAGSSNSRILRNHCKFASTARVRSTVNTWV